MELRKEGEKSHIVYGETLNISEIHSQQNIYREALIEGKPIHLVASAIHSVDTPSLQLLLSFILELKQRGLPLVWQDSSEALGNAVHLLGMQDLLGIDNSP